MTQFRGMGDVIHSVAEATGLARVAHAIAGDDCGCEDRRDLFNNWLPFSHPPSQCPRISRRSTLVRPVRNLLMYLYPIAQHQVWKWNIQQILQRIHLFNGKRIVAIATDGRTDSADEVRKAFGNERIDHWHEIPNDPFRWEMAALPTMLEQVRTCDPNEITFYCHGKGVQGPAHVDDPLLQQQPRIKWATAMYGACLDDIDFVEQQLERKTFAGAFKKRMIHGEGPFRSSWHFAGTFYWFRNARLFALPNWHHFDHQWIGAETYPGQLVGWYQAAGLFCDHPPVLYLPEAWTGQVDQMWADWKQEHGLCTPA